MTKKPDYFLCFYVPKSHVEIVKTAVFNAGAGSIGDYRRCAWQVLGQGQFCPADGAHPFIGEVGELEVVDEYKVEMVCSAQDIRSAVNALKAAHPYEEPVYHVLQIDSGF